MANLAGLDWSDCFRRTRDEERRALVAWLNAEGLGVREFMEVVDRAYAATSQDPRESPEAFLARFGRPAAEAYARRKWLFGGRVAALDMALMSGAFQCDVAPEDLEPCAPPRRRGSPPEELLSELERAMCGAE